MSAIMLATSLAPFIARNVGSQAEIGALYQHCCVQSWRESGFEIFSVNAESEAEAVRAAYPDVEVVVARTDMRAFCGKPLIPVAEMMRALEETGARVGGIVNADVFAAAPGLAERVRPDERTALVFASRSEVSHPYAPRGRVYREGFDAFFFDVARARSIDWDPFTVGLPWWDYALPTAFLFAGLGSVRALNFPMGHLAHRAGWDYASWTRLFEVFRDRFGAGYEALARSERAIDLPALQALGASDRIARLYANHDARRGRPLDEGSTAHRHRLAYSAAVVDLIHEMAGTRDFGTWTSEGPACR